MTTGVFEQFERCEVMGTVPAHPVLAPKVSVEEVHVVVPGVDQQKEPPLQAALIEQKVGRRLLPHAVLRVFGRVRQAIDHPLHVARIGAVEINEIGHDVRKVSVAKTELVMDNGNFDVAVTELDVIAQVIGDLAADVLDPLRIGIHGEHLPRPVHVQCVGYRKCREPYTELKDDPRLPRPDNTMQVEEVELDRRDLIHRTRGEDVEHPMAAQILLCAPANHGPEGAAKQS